MRSKPTKLPELEALIASTLTLMTRHSKSAKAGVEQEIIDHLETLASHPKCQSNTLREVGKKLAVSWRQEARIKELELDDCSSAIRTVRPKNIH